MPIFSDYYETIKRGLAVRKHDEIYSKSLRDLPKVSPPVSESVYNPIIEDIKFTKNGIVSYLVGEKYPVRFYTPQKFVNIVTVYKRSFALIIEKGIIGLLILYFGRKIWSEWSKNYFRWNPILLKEEYWSQPVKEIRRVLKTAKIVDETLKDGISIIFQNDMAYCYRSQDILGELNKDNLQKNPLKEIRRLVDLYISREIGTTHLKKGVERTRKYLWLLRFKGLKEIKAILMDLNIDEIKLSTEDIYWTNIVPGYNYRGIPYEQRLKEYKLEKNNSVAKNVSHSHTNIR